MLAKLSGSMALGGRRPCESPSSPGTGSAALALAHGCGGRRQGKAGQGFSLVCAELRQELLPSAASGLLKNTSGEKRLLL